ncbi:MAG: alpha/beta hydrolase [Flavobacteriales bacterium]|nr:alpha/beta hydrolase [Flavobacteriales bacterium]
MKETLAYTYSQCESEKTPMLFLHGFLESSTMWQVLDLPKDRSVLKVDLPGHGESIHVSNRSDSIEDMAKAVLEVMDEVGLNDFHVVGHSMGGYVAIAMKRMDKRVKRIMLLNSNYWTDSPQKVKDRKRVAEIVQTNQSHFIYEVIPNLFLHPEKYHERVKALIDEAMQMSPMVIAKASIAMSQRADATEFLLENAEDFMCVQGESDPIVSAKRMRRELAETNVHYIELADVGHMAHIESTSAINACLAEFMD